MKNLVFILIVMITMATTAQTYDTEDRVYHCENVIVTDAITGESLFSTERANITLVLNLSKKKLKVSTGKNNFMSFTSMIYQEDMETNTGEILAMYNAFFINSSEMVTIGLSLNSKDIVIITKTESYLYSYLEIQ